MKGRVRSLAETQGERLEEQRRRPWLGKRQPQEPPRRNRAGERSGPHGYLLPLSPGGLRRPLYLLLRVGWVWRRRKALRLTSYFFATLERTHGLDTQKVTAVCPAASRLPCPQSLCRTYFHLCSTSVLSSTSLPLRSSFCACPPPTHVASLPSTPSHSHLSHSGRPDDLGLDSGITLIAKISLSRSFLTGKKKKEEYLRV